MNNFLSPEDSHDDYRRAQKNPLSPSSGRQGMYNTLRYSVNRLDIKNDQMTPKNTEEVKMTDDRPIEDKQNYQAHSEINKIRGDELRKQFKLTNAQQSQVSDTFKMDVSLGSGGPQTISSNNPAQTLSPTLNRFPSNPAPKKQNAKHTNKIQGPQDYNQKQSSMKSLNKYAKQHVKSLTQPITENTIQTPSSNQPSPQQNVLFQSKQMPIEELDSPVSLVNDIFYIKFNAVVKGVNDPTDFVIEIETAEFQGRLEKNAQDIKKTIGEYVHEDYQGYCSIEEYRVVSIKRKKNGMLCEVKKSDKIQMLMDSCIKFLVFFQLKTKKELPSQSTMNSVPSQISNTMSAISAISSPEFLQLRNLEQLIQDNSKMYQNLQKQVSKEMTEQELRLTQKLEDVHRSIWLPQDKEPEFDRSKSFLSLTYNSNQNRNENNNTKRKSVFGKFPTNPAMDVTGVQSIQVQGVSSPEVSDMNYSIHKTDQTGFAEQSHMSFNPNAANPIMGLRQRRSIQQNDVKISHMMPYSPNNPNKKFQTMKHPPIIFQYDQDPLKQLDLVFLYSDPLVSVKTGIHSCDQPLDLDNEYKSLVKSLQKTGKQFTMMKEAISIQSISSIIEKMPHIIHISSHGAFDPIKKEFFLAIENKDEAGQEYQILQSDLVTLLRPSKNNNSAINNIKMAFVSACQSEEIGEIFLNSGVPVVVSVNSDQEIMDEVCQIFSSAFYEYILAGNTIEGSFDKAQKLVEVHPKSYGICCCAHKHSDDCEWYKLYKEDRAAAHALHAKKNCACPEHMTKKRKHLQFCPDYREFKEKLDSLNKKNKNTTLTKQPSEQNKLQSQKTQALKNALKLAVDSDDDCMLDLDSEPDIESMKAFNEETEHECIMCCCQPQQLHNESIKFQLKVADESRREELLNTRIFSNKMTGQLNNLDDRLTNLMKIKAHVDNLMIFGRNIEIYKVVQFLTKGNIKRIMAVTGIEGSGCDLIARQAIKYVIQRNFFSHGSFQIDATDSLTLQGLFQKIKKKMNLLVEDPEEMYEELQNFELIILIEITRQISEKETKDIQTSMSKLIDNTQNLKIVLVVEQDTPLSFKQIQSQKLKTPIEQLEIKALDKIDAANMMFNLNRDNKKFMEKFPNVKKLHEHKIFDIPLMPEQISIISSLMQQDSQSLDEAYRQQIQTHHNDQSKGFIEFNKNKINQVFFDKIIDLYPQEINILYVLCFSQHGLAEFDLKRITLASKNQINLSFQQQNFQFGNWERFLMQFIDLKESQTVQIGQQQKKSADIECDVTRVDSAPAESIQLSMQKMSSHIIKTMAQKQDSVSSPLKKMITHTSINDQNNEEKFKKLESEIQQIQKKTNYCFVKKIKKEQAQEVSLFQIQTSFRNYILEKTGLTLSQKQRFQFQYVKYMSILSRQLMRSIKYQKVQDFDPYLVSSQIDDGIWGEPQSLSLEMEFVDEDNEQYSKQWPIENAVHYFQTHEANYKNFFDTNELKRIISMMKDLSGTKNVCDFIKTVENLDEILINVPSIFIMLNRQNEAEELIQNVAPIANVEELQLTSAKIMLIQASIHLSFQPDNVVTQNLCKAKQVFSNYGNQMALGEILYLECISDIKILVKKQIDGSSRVKKLAKFRDMKSFSQDEELDKDSIIDYKSLNANKDLQSIDEEEEDDMIRKPRNSVKVSSPNPLFKVGSFNSQESQQQKNYLSNVMQIINKLGECRHMLQQGQESNICLARTWVLQADIVIDKLKNQKSLQDKLFEKMPQTNLESIFRKLQEASDMETIDNCEQISTRCVLFMAKIRQMEKNYVASSKLIHDCLRDSQQFGLSVVQNQAKKIADEISAMLSKDSRNVLLFAKSCPICAEPKVRGQKYYNQAFHQGIQDDSEKLIQYFESKEKEKQRQLNIKIDILNERFLRNVSLNGCRLLHISPYLTNIDTQQSHQMIIETDTFEKQVISPEQLKHLLQPQYGRDLDVHFVLIDMPNCEKFAKVFFDLGVPHVVSFKCQPSWNKDVIDGDDFKQIEQSKLNLFVSFVNQFYKTLYPLINDNKSIKESIEQAKNQLLKGKNSLYKELDIDVVHKFSKKGYKNDLLHDLEKSTESGQSQEIKEICDISEIRGSIDCQIESKPFILRDFTKFKQLASSITFKSEEKNEMLQIPTDKSNENIDLQTKKINVYGQKGVGKTRLVLQVADYLRFRYMFGAGVHYFDLAKTKNIDTLAQIFKRKSSKSLTTKQKREKLRKAQSSRNISQSSVEIDKSREEKEDEVAQQVLFIFDNCDEFIKKNTVSFLANINYIQKQFSEMAVVLISEKVLYDDDKQFSRFQLEPFYNYTSKILFQTIIQSTEKKNTEHHWKEAMIEASDLILQSKGNAQLLSILALIYSYGGPILLKKIKIQSIESMEAFKRNIETDQHSYSAIDEDQQQQCINVMDSYNRQKTESSSNTKSPYLKVNTIFSSTGRFSAMNTVNGKSFGSRGMMQRHQQQPNFNSSFKQFHKTSLLAAAAEEKQMPFMREDLQAPQEKMNKEFHQQLEKLMGIDQIEERYDSQSEQDICDQDSEDSRDFSDQQSEDVDFKKSSENFQSQESPNTFKEFGMTLIKGNGSNNVFGDLKGLNLNNVPEEPDLSQKHDKPQDEIKDSVTVKGSKKSRPVEEISEFKWEQSSDEGTDNGNMAKKTQNAKLPEYNLEEVPKQPPADISKKSKSAKIVKIVEEDSSKSSSFPSSKNQAMRKLDIKTKQVSAKIQIPDQSPGSLPGMQSDQRSHVSDITAQTPKYITQFQSNPNAEMDYRITNQEQYTTKYKGFCLEATGYNNKKLKIVIDTEKQILIIFGPKPQINGINNGQNGQYQRRATLVCSTCPGLSEYNPQARRKSVFSSNITDLTEHEHLKPIEDIQIQNINIFTPIFSHQVISDDKENLFNRPFARGLSKRKISSKSSSFASMESSEFDREQY